MTYYETNQPSPQVERLYEKPTITKQEKMSFPLDILNSKYSEPGHICKQCSSCHSCR
ncbi:MAG: hypothetical protein V1888_04195 [archaeon]